MSVKKILRFFVEDLWRIRLEEESRRKAFWLKPLRVVALSIRGFDEDKCMLRASSLTFYTLISIVPILAMAFGIAKGFEFDQLLEDRVREQFQGQEEVLGRAITFADNLLENTKGGLVAGIGIVFLFWAIIKVLGNIEKSFNDIWGIRKHRSWMRKFSDYLSFMLICPVLFIVASSMAIMVTGHMRTLLSQLPYLAFLAGPIRILLRLLPFAVLWGLFAFMYAFLPNGKVSVRSAVLGGILAGTAYQLLQWAYLAFQFRLAHYNAIYGSFAALPLFLLWLQASWLIILYGAEFSFAHQNVDTYEFERDCAKISPAFKRLVCFAVLHLCVRRFRHGEAPLTAAELAKALGTPIRLVNDVLHDLVEAGVVSEVVSQSDRAGAFQPALDIEHLTLQDVHQQLENNGTKALPLAKTEGVEKLSGSLAAFRETLIASPHNVLLKDL